MATFSAHSSGPISRLDSGKAHPGSARGKEPGRRQSWLRRLVVGGARRLHEVSFAYPALVKAFRGLQRVGINVTPNHFYWPIPDISDLEIREWPIYPPPAFSKYDLNRQIVFGRELASEYGDECQFSSKPNKSTYHYHNGYFEAVDAEVAYGVVRRSKPSRVVEIGTGYSTRILAAALEKNFECDGVEGRLISVDPNPERFSEKASDHLVEQFPLAVQDLDLEFFDTLERGDILFIDSSHVIAVGSDVVREYLEILPRLRPGVLVHIHDIFLPSDYPRNAVIENLWFWSEQYLLQAFLSFNSAFEVLWGSSAMQIHCPWVLAECFPNWQHSYRSMPKSKRRFVPTLDQDRVWPSSFWMQRV
ncbi:MAG: class I SAM-dependent methyltransferase [Acidobacteria bacterium]|nr:class I SAM-dependent methyltransferase [Acidobacteriota bacterium]